MTGKNKCKILKEIRQRIANENDIPFVTAECKYQGNCKGTCPRCEAELAYLEAELRKRKKLGKTVVIGGVALAAILLGMKGCSDAVEEIEDMSTQGIVGPMEVFEIEPQSPDAQ